MGWPLDIYRTPMCGDLLIGAKLRSLARPVVSLYKRVVVAYEFVLGNLQGGAKNEGIRSSR